MQPLRAAPPTGAPKHLPPLYAKRHVDRPPIPRPTPPTPPTPPTQSRPKS